MKHLYFICALLIASLSISWSATMGKQEAFQIITSERVINGEIYEGFNATAYRIDKLSTKYELYQKYEKAGLITIKHTTERVWKNGFVEEPAIITTLTDLGKKSLCDNTTNLVMAYSYAYDKVDDIQLIKKITHPADDRHYRTIHLAFLIGSITSVSDFGAVENIKVGDRYPLPDNGENTLYVCELIMDYEYNKVTRTQVNFDKILEREKEALIEQYKAEN